VAHTKEELVGEHVLAVVVVVVAAAPLALGFGGVGTQVRVGKR
jgi:hypothetical protein